MARRRRTTNSMSRAMNRLLATTLNQSTSAATRIARRAPKLLLKAADMNLTNFSSLMKATRNAGRRQVRRAGEMLDATTALQHKLSGLTPPALPKFEIPGLTLPTAQAPQASPLTVPKGAQYLDLRFSGPGGARPYKLYVPSRYRTGRAVPLIVMLHGCTQSPDDIAAGTRMNEFAEREGFLVAYPGQTRAANQAKCWNWFNPAQQQRDSGEPLIIAGITRQVMQDYAIDPRRVFIAGMSAGGATAAIMGNAYPELYAAIGVHSGLAFGSASDAASAATAMRGDAADIPLRDGVAVPAIVFHGGDDRTVHASNGDQVIRQSQANGIYRTSTQQGSVPGGRSYTRTLHADPSGKTVLEQWAVHGSGHAWSGGSVAGSYTDPKGPDASAEMLRFFREHPKK
jgi:poly(hydroxyalkanoate) depolymerase family esterase